MRGLLGRPADYHLDDFRSMAICILKALFSSGLYPSKAASGVTECVIRGFVGTGGIPVTG